MHINYFGGVLSDCNSFVLFKKKNKDHPGKCWEESREEAYDFGPNYPEGECIEIHCSKDFSMQYLT